MFGSLLQVCITYMDVRRDGGMEGGWYLDLGRYLGLIFLITCLLAYLLCSGMYVFKCVYVFSRYLSKSGKIVRFGVSI